MSDVDMDRFLAAVEKLPPYGGVAFRGLSADAVVPQVGVLTAVVSTSMNPRVATENFIAPGVLVLLSRTGRDLSALSARPDDMEVVFLPGTAWRLLAVVDYEGTELRIFEEVDLTGRQGPPPAWGATIDDVVMNVLARWRHQRDLSDVPVGTPGKFVGDWPAQEYPAN